MTQFGVGYSELVDSYKAGVEAAQKALKSYELSADSLILCFLFCTSRHEAKEFYEGVKSIIHETPCIGGFANGTLSGDQFGYDGYQCVVGVMQSDTVDIHLFKQEGIAFNEYETGKGLFQQMANEKYSTDPHVLLLFDAVNRQKGRFQMNYVTPLLEGGLESIGNWPNTAGARLMGDMKFKPTYQWFKNSMIQNAAMAVAFTGNIEMDVLRLDGCTPASSYHKVTKSEGATILEIDNVPATDFVGKMLGSEVEHDYEQMKFFVTLGKNLGDKWDRHKSQYVNRMCVGVNPKKKGLIMAEMDLVEGSEFQFMRRGYEMDMIEEKVTFFIQNMEKEGKKPLFAFYLNCAGRATAYSQNDTEDVELVQNAVNNKFPLLGIYEAGELAMIQNDLQVFDWTGVFCLFSEKIES